MTSTWRRQVEEGLERAVAENGHDVVADFVQDVLGRLRREPLARRTMAPSPFPVLGVDACATGWVGILIQPDGRLSVHHGSTIGTLVEHVRHDVALRLVAIDIPIGLPDSGRRQADQLVRRELAGRASSVFSTLTRAAYEASTYAEARAANQAATGGTSASAQAFALRAKILQVDAWLRARPAVDVIELHPELSFARLAGRPIVSSKKDAGGLLARRSTLEQAGIDPPAWYRGSGFAEDDLLDACAAAWSAVRYARGEAESFPATPEVFSDGIPAAIRV